MPNYNATANLAAQTGNTEDVNVNGFAVFSDDAITPSELDTWFDAIDAFYEACYAAGALCGRAQTGHLVKFYATDTGVPNYPIDEATFGLNTAPPGIDLPSEVSLCVSYANDSESSIPRARRRGRIYIPGHSEANNTNGRPLPALVEDLADAYEAYADAVNAISGVSAGVWSRANATVYPIERVWVDNEWDTVRSRGGKSTARQTRTL